MEVKFRQHVGELVYDLVKGSPLEEISNSDHHYHLRFGRRIRERLASLSCDLLGGGLIVQGKEGLHKCPEFLAVWNNRNALWEQNSIVVSDLPSIPDVKKTHTASVPPARLDDDSDDLYGASPPPPPLLNLKRPLHFPTATQPPKRQNNSNSTTTFTAVNPASVQDSVIQQSPHPAGSHQMVVDNQVMSSTVQVTWNSFSSLPS